MAPTPTPTAPAARTATPATTQQVAALATIIRRNQAAQRNHNTATTATVTTHTADIAAMRVRLDNVEPVVTDHQNRLTALEGGTGMHTVGFIVGVIIGLIVAFALRPLYDARGQITIWTLVIYAALGFVFGVIFSQIMGMRHRA